MAEVSIGEIKSLCSATLQKKNNTDQGSPCQGCNARRVSDDGVHRQGSGPEYDSWQRHKYGEKTQSANVSNGISRRRFPGSPSKAYFALLVFILLSFVCCSF